MSQDEKEHAPDSTPLGSINRPRVAALKRRVAQRSSADPVFDIVTQHLKAVIYH